MSYPIPTPTLPLKGRGYFQRKIIANQDINLLDLVLICSHKTSPLCKRGVGGDLTTLAPARNPPTSPFYKGGLSRHDRLTFTAICYNLTRLYPMRIAQHGEV